jgi:hypothetical protein
LLASQIEAAMARSGSVYPSAETFLHSWPSYSAPAAVRCTDGRDYVIKASRDDKAVVNEQIVARVGRCIGAPVARPRFVELTQELIDLEPKLRNRRPGIAHATELIEDCSDRSGVEYTNVPENRARFALLAVLYGWTHAGDHQLIYRNVPPRLVYSVDHGHFFPGGPHWVSSFLADGSPQVVPAAPFGPLVSECALRGEEIARAVIALVRVTADDIVEAVAAPPADWAVTLAERVAMAEYLLRRRDALLRPFGDAN